MLKILNFLLLTAGFVLITLWCLAQDIFIVNDCVLNPMFNIIDYLHANWIVFALVISEIAALLPTKFSGILHLIVKLGHYIFKKNSSKTKNF